MAYNPRLLPFVLLVAAHLSLTGCAYYKRSTNPPQNQNPQSQNNSSQVQEYKLSKKSMIDAPIISQKPELKSGCEVTSLAMLLQYTGVKIDKMILAEKIKKDPTPLELYKNGDIKKWGDPNEGFVGDITGKEKGFAVYPKPMIELMEQYLPGRSVDLTGQPFDSILKYVEEKRPVIVWTTIDFKLPDKFEQWEKDGKIIKASFDEHAVLLVGYDEENLYVNNPYNGQKKQKIPRDTLLNSWNSIGSMAISYK